jgi:hypothetical protein
MLDSFRAQTLHGATVHPDDDPDRWHVYYLRPSEPTWRVNARGIPQLLFLIYRTPVDRPNGRKGGYVAFDTEFYVPDATRALIRTALQAQTDAFANANGRQPRPVQLDDLAITSARCFLNIADADSLFFERVLNPARPSRFGKRVASWTVELSPDGAALVDEALRGQGASVFQPVYEIEWFASLPPLEVTASFNASTFYAFTETRDADWNFWGEDDYRHTISESLRQSQSTVIDVKGAFLDNEANRAVVDKARDWAQRTLEKAIEKRILLKAGPPSDEDRKEPDGIEDLRIDFHQHQIDSFSVLYREKSLVTDSDTVSGTMPALDGLTDVDGRPIDPDTLIRRVDLNHEFFRTLRVNVHVDADFAGLPIHSVETRLDYAGKPMLLMDADGVAGDVDGEFRFTEADAVGRFVAPVDGPQDTYTYSYTVNYRNESRKLEAGPFETPVSNTIQTISVGDAGILDVKVLAGDIDFTYIASARVTLWYEDDDVPRFENAFELDRDHQVHRWQRVIFGPRRKPYGYRVKYTFADGREHTREVGPERTDELYVDDIFHTRRVAVRARSDLANHVSDINVDLVWFDEDHDYRVEKSITLNATNPFFDWTFPVITGSTGTLRYTERTVLRDRSEIVEPEREATGSTIVVGPARPDEIVVEVFPDLLDFQRVRLVKVDLVYDDGAGVHKQDSLVFRGPGNPQVFRVTLRNPAKRSYTWTASYFMTNGDKHTVGPNVDDTEALILEMPVS